MVIFNAINTVHKWVADLFLLNGLKSGIQSIEEKQDYKKISFRLFGIKKGEMCRRFFS